VIRDPDLLERLGSFPTEAFDGEVFRITRRNLDPVAPSTAGGRWMQRGGAAVLYTSLIREGALAEISFHWGRLTPLPSRPALLHRLGVTAKSTLRLILADLGTLGLDTGSYQTGDHADMQRVYEQTQRIGDAVAYLGCDGLLAPSARWACENLVLFTENHGTDMSNALEVLESEECDWLAWGRHNGTVEESDATEG